MFLYDKGYKLNVIINAVFHCLPSKKMGPLRKWSRPGLDPSLSCLLLPPLCPLPSIHLSLHYPGLNVSYGIIQVQLPLNRVAV